MTKLTSSIDEGVLRLVRDQGARRAGQFAALKGLLQAWRQARLRHDDLLSALRHLKAAGFLRLDRDSDGNLHLTLLPAGQAHIAAVRDDLPGLLYLAGTTAGNGEVPRREDTFSPAGRRRRKTDVRSFVRLPEIEAGARPAQ